MILVSGPDNSGKTSLVKALVEKASLNNLPKCKDLPLWEHPEEYTQWVIKTLTESGRFDIVDRCFIDEIVYGPIMRGKICFNDEQYIGCYYALQEARPLIIITDPGEDEIMRTYHEREQYPDIKKNLEVSRRFREVVGQLPFSECPVYFFDYRFDPNYELVTDIVRYYIMNRRDK